MLLFSLECSAAAASAAIYRDEKLLGEEFLNVPQTHSVTLLPMAKSLLEHTGISPAQIDYYAVSRGPGSFTGLRIGIAAIKGLAFPDDTPCIGVSTPEAIAYGLLGFEGTVIPMMDARCGQVYTALFQGKDGRLTRLSEDEALPLSELKEKLKSCTGPLWLCGDGAHLGLAAWGDVSFHVLHINIQTNSFTPRLRFYALLIIRNYNLSNLHSKDTLKQFPTVLRITKHR